MTDNGRTAEIARLNPNRPTIKEILDSYHGRMIDDTGVLIAEINGTLASHGYSQRVERFDDDRQPVLGPDWLGMQEPEAAATVPHERGTQPQDAGGHDDAGKARDRQADREREDAAWRADARDGEPPLDKFARVWTSNYGSA